MIVKMTHGETMDEILAGLIIRGSAAAIENLINRIEADRRVQLVFVKRAPLSSFLFILELKKGERGEDRRNVQASR